MIKKKYELAILGGYGLRNFGDDALMYILHKKLCIHYQETDIIYICTPDTYLKILVNNTMILDIRENNSLDTEILLYGGGTQFYSFKSKKTFLYKLLKNIQNPTILFKKIIKSLYRKNYRVKRTAAIGIGVGPFLVNTNNSVETNTKKLFCNMDFIGVRDDYSLKKCQEWGISNVEQYADLCYLMDDEFKLANKKVSHAIKKIGIIVRDWDHTNEGSTYYSKIPFLIEKLSTLGYDVNIIIFSQKRDLYWLNKFKNHEKTLIWNADENSIEKFITQLDDYDLFITARYHGAVFSTLLNKPFISISVEQKLDLVSSLYENGSKKWMYPFDIDVCVNHVKEINKDYNIFKNSVNKTTLKQKRLAKKMLQDFLSYTNANMELK